MRHFTTLCAFMALATGLSIAAQSASAAEAEASPCPECANVALGASYSLTPAPNYAHCTDPGDSQQLTDGDYTGGYFWTQESTVGWRNTRPILIELDLEQAQAIRGISVHMGAGRAGVTWPGAIHVFTAGEDRQYRYAGDLVELSTAQSGQPPGDYGTHAFWTDSLKTHGRYVAMAIWGLPFVFVDEIEVYAGDEAWLRQEPTGEPVKGDLMTAAWGVETRERVKGRLREDFHAVWRNLVPHRMAKEPLLEKTDAARAEITQQIEELRIPSIETFQAILPLNEVHRRIFALQALHWETKGVDPVTVWQSGLWDPLHHLADPPRDPNPRIEMHMMRNEYRAASFNISNAAGEEMQARIAIEGLPNGTSPSYIRVHECQWTGTTGGTPVAAALPEAERNGDGSYSVSVPSGMTRQVWLTFHPEDLPAGTYEGEIEVTTPSSEHVVPVSLRVYPLDFPDKPALHFGGWDYTDAKTRYGVTPENRESLIAHLRERFVDTPWATSRVLARGEYGSDGAMTSLPDTTAFDAWLDLWPDAGQYRVFAAVGDTFAQWRRGTEAFNRAVGDWMQFWADHIKERGLDPGQFAFLLVDEPHDSEQAAVILDWIEAIKAASTGIRVWEDPTYREAEMMRDGVNHEMLEACDIVCPERSIFLGADQAYRDYFAKLPEKGVDLAFYACRGPAKLLDPYAYYRLQAWTCKRYGAKAMYFWAFGDNGGASSWNEYAVQHPAYTPLFLDDDTVVPGKHLEACREGIEDFEYLHMLEEAVRKGEESGGNPELLAQARQLLSEAVERVCQDVSVEDLYWHEAEGLDRSLADAYRRQILEMLVRLRETS